MNKGFLLFEVYRSKFRYLSYIKFSQYKVDNIYHAVLVSLKSVANNISRVLFDIGSFFFVEVSNRNEKLKKKTIHVFEVCNFQMQMSFNVSFA